MKFTKVFSFIFLLVALMMIGFKPLKADSPLSFTKGEVLNSQEIIEGVTWEKYKANSVNDDGAAGRQVVNVATFAPGVAHIVVWSNVGAKGISASNLLSVAQNYESTHPNYTVIAAVNGDYFDINGDKSMRSGCVAEGAVLKETTQSIFYSVGFKDDFDYVITNKGGSIPVSENYTLDIFESTQGNVLRSATLPAFNTMPSEGEISYCTSLSESAVPYEAFKVELSSNMKLVDCSYLVGKIGERVTDSSYTGPMLVAASVDYANLLNKGTPVKIYKTTAGAWAGVTNAIGVGGQTLKNGVVQTAEEIGDYGGAHVTGRHPRTSFGFKEDGSFCLMVIDGRQETQAMDGVSERENGLAMKNEGCTQAFNLDGGGSSTFAVMLDGKLTVTNSPSDGGLRSDSDFLLVVVPKIEVEMNASTQIEADGMASISGTSVITPMYGLQYKSAEIYIDGVATGEAAENFKVTGLEKGKTYNVALYVTYGVGKTNYVKPLYSKNVTTAGVNDTTKVAPSNFQLDFVDTMTGFNMVLSYDDPSKALCGLSIKYNNYDAIINRTFDKATVKVYCSVSKNFNIEVQYTYRLALGNVETVTLNYTYDYKLLYTYRFFVDDELVKEQIGREGEQIVAPTDFAVPEGYEFEAWDKEVGTLSQDIDFHAVLKKASSPDPNPIDNEGGKQSGGFNCNFGAYLITSMIAALGLAIIIWKRRS